MKHYLCSELSHLSMRHKLRGLTLLEDALDYDDLPENSEAALLAALTPLITREKFLLRKRAIEALTALARRRPGGRLHCPAPALVAAWQALQDCATDPEVLLRDRSAASAAALLGALSPKSQAEPLRRLLAALGADSWRVREQALLTLARGAAAQPPLAVPLARAAEVARLLQHERAEVAEAAALLLQQMHSGHGDELTKLLASLHAEVPQLAGVLTVRDTAPPAAERRPLHESKPRAKSREEIVLAIPRELARSPKAVPRRAMPNGGSAEAPGSSRSQPPGSPVSLRRELAASSKMRRLTEAAEELEAPVPSAVPAGAALASEMDDLRTTLLNTKGAWEARAAALRRVWALMLGGMSLRDDFGTAQLKSLVEPLVACLSDLRSSLVRDACCVMRLLALLHGDALEPLLDAHEKGWVATLLRLTSTTQTAVIGEAVRQNLPRRPSLHLHPPPPPPPLFLLLPPPSFFCRATLAFWRWAQGHAAMRTIIRCCRLGKALPLLVNGCFDKNGTKALQGRCAECVTIEKSIERVCTCRPDRTFLKPVLPQVRAPRPRRGLDGDPRARRVAAEGLPNQARVASSGGGAAERPRLFLGVLAALPRHDARHAPSSLRTPTCRASQLTVASSCLRACRAARGSGAQGGGSGTSVAAGRPGVRVRTHATSTHPPPVGACPGWRCHRRRWRSRQPRRRLGSPRCGANRGEGDAARKRDEVSCDIRHRRRGSYWGGRGDARTVATDRGRRLEASATEETGRECCESEVAATAAIRRRVDRRPRGGRQCGALDLGPERPLRYVIIGGRGVGFLRSRARIAPSRQRRRESSRSALRWRCVAGSIDSATAQGGARSRRRCRYFRPQAGGEATAP